MDNQAFELHGESFPPGKEGPKKEAKKSNRSLMKIFLACLLACGITTVLGVLTLALVSNDASKRDPDGGNVGMSPSPSHGRRLDVKFQFLNHLKKSKVYTYPGGQIQWARFRKELLDYGSEEEVEFGRSLNIHRSQMTFGTLRIKSKGLRAPHWHFNANEHGYLQQGSAWVGVMGADDNVVTTYNVTAGQVVFFPRNTIHWLKNVGEEDCVFLLFFSTHEELQTLDMDDVFFWTPEDVAARALKPPGGVNFIRTFQKQAEDQAINLPPNLEDLVQNATYGQSPDHLVWRYFYNLKGSAEDPFPGGSFQWARYRRDATSLNGNEKIFSESLHKHENTLTLATLRIRSNSLGQPHFHFNAHEMGYVLSGCGQVGVVLSGTSINFNIDIGDVIFFPVGSQHYIKSVCEEELLLLLAYSTGNQLETLRMSSYFQGTADHILAQLFFKAQAEIKMFSRTSQP
ncbi:uncharacterized protein LOC115618498 isoform X3 [Strigops habroptila]|uniref:Uncharacterized LOC115618498 n=2 Tax=Strigops habroptila TaxID=2489341 RepID=A0A672UJH3_STRHB|nr:uncharacterized protein LOC115618498 isoform X3 [Strigops habroptila]